MCGISDNRVLILDKHHLLGRANSKEWVYLCLNCHRILTTSQNSMAPKIRRKNADEEDKRAYIDTTMGAALELFGKYLKERGLKHGNSTARLQ